MGSEPAAPQGAVQTPVEKPGKGKGAVQGAVQFLAMVSHGSHVGNDLFQP